MPRCCAAWTCIRDDHGDPESWDVHHWQDVNPVHTEALVQLTCGGPQIIYHGGLLHVRLRYFDADEATVPVCPPMWPRWSPPGCDSRSRWNWSIPAPATPAVLVIQAGAFGEHHFTTATTSRCPTGEDAAGKETRTVAINDRRVRVELPAGRSRRSNSA